MVVDHLGSLVMNDVHRLEMSMAPGAVQIASAVGKEISTVRLRRTEDGHYPGEGFLGAGAHIHRFGG